MNPHVRQSHSLTRLANTLWTNRTLIGNLSKREIQGRYKGSAFGSIWSILNPLLMLSVFTFVFGEIFQSRWPGAKETGGISFAAALFTGLVLFNFFSECIGRAPTLIVSNPNYVKKVVFPIEVLPIISMISALFHLGTSYLVLIVLIAFSEWGLHIGSMQAAIILIPLTILISGLSWLLAALGAYLRDIGQIIAPILTGTMFLSPIFYQLSSIDQKFHWLFTINPISFPIEQMRNAVLYNKPIDWFGYWIYFAIALIVAKAGYYVFQKTRHGFSDVL